MSNETKEVQATEILKQQLSEETSKLKVSENLIKRFLLEKGYEEGKFDGISHFDEIHYQTMMYENLKAGKIRIDTFQFEVWLNNLIQYKNLFGRYLKNAGLIMPDSRIYEVTESNEISSLNTICMHTDKRQIVESMGEGCFGRPNSSNIDGHLIINGIYDNELIYIARACNVGSFSVGYCGLKSSKYAKRVLEYYKQMKRFLQTLANEEKIEVLEDDFGRTITEEESVRNPGLIAGEKTGKIYVLNYKVKPVYQYEPPCPVIQRQSDR